MLSIRSSVLCDFCATLYTWRKVKQKKVNSPWMSRGEVELWLYSFFNLGARRGGWSTPRSRLLYPWERDPVPIVQEIEWATGPVWTSAESLTPTGIRSPDRPARSKSLYWLGHPDPHHWQYHSVTSKLFSTVDLRVTFVLILFASVYGTSIQTKISKFLQNRKFPLNICFFLDIHSNLMFTTRFRGRPL